jgi:hypothetical protein
MTLRGQIGCIWETRQRANKHYIVATLIIVYISDHICGDVGIRLRNARGNVISNVSPPPP